jgi:hypothetical protein
MEESTARRLILVSLRHHDSIQHLREILLARLMLTQKPKREREREREREESPSGADSGN